MSRRTILLEEVKKLGLDPNKNHPLSKLMQVKRSGGVKPTSTSQPIDDDDHDLDDREDVGDDVEPVDVTDTVSEVEVAVVEEPKPQKKRLFVKKVTHSE